MVRNSWSNVVRSLLIIINIIIIVPGCLLIYASFKVSGENQHRDPLQISASGSSSSSSANPVVTYSCIVGALVGSLVVLKSLLGLYGAIKRSKSILSIYALILSLVILMLLVLVIYSYVLASNKNRTYQELDRGLVNSTLAMYNYVDTQDPRTTLIDYVQRQFACCGLNSPNDWTEYSNHKIPKSCCSEPIESSLPTFKYCAESDYRIGCWRPIQDHFFKTLLPITRDYMLVKIYFNVFCVALSGLLIRSIQKEHEVV